MNIHLQGKGILIIWSTGKRDYVTNQVYREEGLYKYSGLQVRGIT